jgi:aryl-alcohol dehydrogenase-like predicted oxidoreductase
MTKVGRIAALEFNYDPAWVRFSVERSLERFRTSYLDVVFCHDIEYVTDEDAVVAVGVLFDMVAEGKVHYVGVSGYALDKLIRVSNLVRERYGRPLDTVQNWAQLTLQNTTLERNGLQPLKEAGVDCIFNSSPMCIGLLREGGVPVGSLGDFHPAPAGLREAAAHAALWLKEQGEDLASLALRYAISQHAVAEPRPPGACTIFGGGSIWEIDENFSTVQKILKPEGSSRGDLRDLTVVDEDQRKIDQKLVDGVRNIFGEWLDYGFTSPDKGWDILTKRMTLTNGVSENKGTLL